MRVLAVCPIPSDGTAWWRVVSPLSVMREQFAGTFEFEVVPDCDHVQVSKYDLLLLQRPIRPLDVQLIKYAKRIGVPVVIDYDDDYTDIPANNPRVGLYSPEEVQANIRECLTTADLVLVSTLALKDKWKKLNKRIAIVPNGFDDRMVLERGGPRLPTRTVLWRGGDSHNEDLDIFSDAIVRAAHTGPSSLFHFVGTSVYRITPRMPQLSVIEHSFSDVLTYFGLLGQLRPNILMVPLAKTPFNDAKSNISIFEGAWAGAAVLAPDWDEWKVEGVTNYSSPADFGDKLTMLMNKPAKELSDMAASTWKAVKDRMLVSRCNHLRGMLFTKLIEEKRATRAKSSLVDDKLLEIANSVNGKDEQPANDSVSPVQEPAEQNEVNDG